MNDEPSQAALAKALGLSKSRVTALKAQGMPLDSLESAQAWRTAHQSIARRKRPADEGKPLTDDRAVRDEARGAFDRARTRREIAEAKLSEHREAELRGELIRVAAVEAVWAQALGAAREHLLQVRARLAPMLAVESDAVKIEQMLDDEHSQALRHMADARVQAATTEVSKGASRASATDHPRTGA